MASKSNFIGLGVPPALANIFGAGGLGITAQGASQASAAQMAGNERLYYVNASNSGNYINLPNVGGDTGCLLGDVFNIVNLLSASVVLTGQSTVNLYGAGTSSTAGTTGVSLAANTAYIAYPISASTWVYK